MNTPHPRGYGDVLATVGNTPLIRLNKVTEGLHVPIYGKAEFFNPGGSLKDRIGLSDKEPQQRNAFEPPSEAVPNSVETLDGGSGHQLSHL